MSESRPNTEPQRVAPGDCPYCGGTWGSPGPHGVPMCIECEAVYESPRVRAVTMDADEIGALLKVYASQPREGNEEPSLPALDEKGLVQRTAAGSVVLTALGREVAAYWATAVERRMYFQTLATVADAGGVNNPRDCPEPGPGATQCPHGSAADEPCDAHECNETVFVHRGRTLVVTHVRCERCVFGLAARSGGGAKGPTLTRRQLRTFARIHKASAMAWMAVELGTGKKVSGRGAPPIGRWSGSAAVN